MKIWVIITCSLIPMRYEERKREYIAGISKALKLFKDPKYKVVIVENHSKLSNPLYSHTTFLNRFNVPVLYTKNNIFAQKTENYGIMEIMDINDCIKHFGIQDDDFIVKLTGRYILDEDSLFFKVIDNLEEKPYTAVVRFGQFDEFVKMFKSDNCVSGLIGLKCKYVKQIEVPQLHDEETSIEMNWAKVICNLNDSEICMMERLGLYMKPKSMFNLGYGLI